MGKSERQHPPDMLGKVPYPDRPPTRLALRFWRVARWLERRAGGGS